MTVRQLFKITWFPGALFWRVLKLEEKSTFLDLATFNMIIDWKISHYKEEIKIKENPYQHCYKLFQHDPTVELNHEALEDDAAADEAFTNDDIEAILCYLCCS